MVTPKTYLSSKIVSMTPIFHPGDSNSGPRVEIYVLCLDGSCWVQYSSSGTSNVPGNGGWYPVAVLGASCT